jgi:hypothetical protein
MMAGSASQRSAALTPLRKNLLVQLQEKKTQCGKGGDSTPDKLKKCLTDVQSLIKEHSDIVDRIAAGMALSSQVGPQ